MISENLSEKAAASKATGQADLCDGFFSIGQQPTGCLQAVAFDVFRRGGVQKALKRAIAFPLADESCRGDIGYADMLRIMLVNIDHHLFSLIACAAGAGFNGRRQPQ